MVENDAGKLVTLLSYLIEHNNEHGEELIQLAGKAKGAAGEVARDHLLEAAQLMEKSTGSLVKALAELNRS
jgi:hypothetical protein